MDTIESTESNGITDTTTTETVSVGESLDGQTQSTVDVSALEEQNKNLLSQLSTLSEQFEQLKEYTGFGEGDDPEDTDTTEPTAEVQQLTAQVDGYREAMQAHVQASIENLPEQQQQLIKTLGGDDPLAQFRALTELQKAGMLAPKAPKPKHERGTHQGRADSGSSQGRPLSLPEIRAEAAKDLMNL